ncbi:MAG: threonylcarbamoyl-AMP synthase [Sedimentisphaerales bacterium]|nr:threonylcarbamoyl-AMP synthase [Sedimentisphaerales bacterium]
MKTDVIKVNPEQLDAKAIKKAAKKIDSGGIVAFPTETVYGLACMARNDSLEKLSQIKGRESSKHYTLHIGDKEKVFHYVPHISLRAQKLIEKAWPGPLTIVFELDDEELVQAKTNVKKDVFENLYKNNTIGIRCPDNAIAIELLNRTKNPVLAPSANISGNAALFTAEQVLADFNGKIDILLDGGPTKYQKSSTVAKIGKTGIEILREGFYTKKDLEKLWKVQILFVCTGNTCRSPMAEGIFKKRLAEKLGCKVDQVEEMGYKIVSAGTIGASGWSASLESMDVCAANGINISKHVNSALTCELIKESDLIYVMSRNHKDHVLGLCPESIDKCFLMDEQQDIPDPIGQSRDVYNKCFEMIAVAIDKRLSEIKP